MQQILLSAERLTKRYGSGDAEANVIKNISLQVSEGEYISVMGQSGCGKSTLLYLLGGLETPTSGSIHFLGKDILKMSDSEKSKIRCREIGFVFQFYNLVENLTVEENILLPLVMAGEKISAHKNDLKSILDALSLTKKRKAFPTELSGGQQQRVAIARAVITKPKIILADEPTGNLDSENSEQVIRLFRRINEQYNIAIVLVTHSEHIASYGKRIITMSDGKIISDRQSSQK